MKNSELIKQLKSLKESVKTASRQAEMDEYIYERMQNIAGIVNEKEYKMGDLISVDYHGPSDTAGSSYQPKYYKVISDDGDFVTAKSEDDGSVGTFPKSKIGKASYVSAKEIEGMRAQQAAVDKFNADRKKQFGK